MTNPTFTITRSYSEKVQMKQYEPKDFFCSLEYCFYDKYPTDEEISVMGNSLYLKCREQVRYSIAQELENMKPSNHEEINQAPEF